MKNKILSNAVWNAVNGGSSAIVAVMVPPFLTRQLTPEAYGTWALALQVGAYVNLLGFGLQMAVGRYVAYHEAQGRIDARDGIVATAFWFLSGMALVAVAGITAIAVLLPIVLPELPVDLMGQARMAILLVGLSLALNLPTTVFAAVFIGRQESHIPAAIQGAGRLLLAFSLIAAGFSGDLRVLGLTYLIVSSGTAITLWSAWRRRTHAPKVARRHVNRHYGFELAGFCFSLTVWNFAMFLISGLDLLIVGHYEYARTPYFAICVTLATLVAGTLSSLASALVPATAGMQATGDVKGLQALLVRSSRLIVAAALLLTLPLALEGEVVLRLWVGREYAAMAAGMLSFMIVAAAIRNLAVPYVTTAIGLGYQRRIILTPIIEASITLGLSLYFARGAGAMGVAEAKIWGGVLGVLMVLVVHPLRIPLGGVTRRALFGTSIVRPMVSVPAVLIVAAGIHFVGLHGSFFGLITIGLATLISIWFLTLRPEDRSHAIVLTNRLLHRGQNLDKVEA